MDNSILMAVTDRCDDLSEDSPRVFLRQFAAFVDVIIQLPLCATIQHQNYPLFVLKNFKDIDDVGMVQFGHDFDFSSDSVDFCFIVNLQLFDVLNCNLQKKKAGKLKFLKSLNYLENGNL